MDILGALCGFLEPDSIEKFEFTILHPCSSHHSFNIYVTGPDILASIEVNENVFAGQFR